MIFISYAELAQDVIAWSQKLPRNIDAIAGVPRSGMVPAAMLALHRNVRLTTVEDLRDGRIFTGGFRDQHVRLKRVLVVDDSALSGKSLAKAKGELAHIDDVHIDYGVVYASQRTKNIPHCKILDMPRIFEWNWLHHFWLGRACMDIDGVLCRDPTRQENDDSLRYRRFLDTAEPLHLPTVEVHTLVTSRLERYRTPTEEWLQKHKVKYRNLVMHPAKSARLRRASGDHADRKAAIYKNSQYGLFIESSIGQAIEINRLTKKPVFCTDTMELYV